MSATSGKRQVCSLCQSSVSSTRQPYRRWTESSFCQGCITKISGLIQLTVNRSHSEILGRLGLLTPKDGNSRNKFVARLIECAASSVFTGIHEFYPNERFYAQKEPSQPTLPGVHWEDEFDRLMHLDVLKPIE